MFVMMQLSSLLSVKSMLPESPQKFRNHRVLDELQLVRLITGGQLFHFPLDRLRVLGFQQPVIILGGNVALQRADTPRLLCRFFRVPVACSFILDL